MSLAVHGLLLAALQQDAAAPVMQQAAVTVELLAQRPARPAPPAARNPAAPTPTAHAARPAREARHQSVSRRSRVKAKSAAARPQPAATSPRAAEPKAVGVAQKRQIRPAAATAVDRAARRQKVKAHLEAHKFYPASARRRGIEGEVALAFALDKEGWAKSLRIEAGSGYAVLDDAAVQTVKRAEPFPVAGGSYRFRLRFHRL